MIKKICFFICFIFCYTSSIYAGNFYISPSLLLSDTTSPNGSYRGLSPHLSFGYREALSLYNFLAAELFAIPVTATLSDNTGNLPNLKTTRSFGLSLIPGFLISSNVIGSLRFGIISSKFDGPNTTQTGGQVGIGLETFLDRKLSVRGEYDYTFYGSISGIGAPKTDQFFLGLIYYFNE